MRAMKSRGIRHAVESILTALLSSTQHIPIIEPFYGIMFYPLFFFLLSFPILYSDHPGLLELEIDLLFFSKDLMFGRLIAMVGLAIFLLAGTQFLRKRGELVDTGFYAVVRHPQYLGIVVMTLGVTIMCLQVASHLDTLGIWIVQVFGYILLARYEERHLVKEYGARYQGYKQRVPFILPLPCPPKIPETLFTLSFVFVIAFLCSIIFSLPP